MSQGGLVGRGAGSQPISWEAKLAKLKLSYDSCASAQHDGTVLPRHDIVSIYPEACAKVSVTSEPRYCASTMLDGKGLSLPQP